MKKLLAIMLSFLLASSMQLEAFCLKNQLNKPVTVVLERENKDYEPITLAQRKKTYCQYHLLDEHKKTNPITAVIAYKKAITLPPTITSEKELPAGGTRLAVPQDGRYLLRGRKRKKLFGRKDSEKSMQSTTNYYRVLQTAEGPTFDTKPSFIVYKEKYETEEEKKPLIRKKK